MATGFIFTLNSYVLVLSTTADTIWDVIQNAWGLVILCFTVILTRFTTFMNVRQRNKITKIEENEGRSDIVSILTTQYKLSNSAFKKELESVGYFYKSRLPSDDLKRL